jgi:hypothetical protein
MDTGSGSAMAASRSAAATGSAAGAAGEAKPPCTATPTGKLVDATGELRYTLKNTSTRPWHYCNVYGFAYDKAGKFLGRGSMSSNVGLNPGEEQPASIQIRDDKDKPLAEPASAVYELVASDVFFDDKSEWKEKVDFYGHTKATGPTVRITK